MVDDQTAMGQGKKHGYNHTSVAHGQPPLLYRENEHEPQQQYSCPRCWLAVSRIANTLQPMASKISYKHDIL